MFNYQRITIFFALLLFSLRFFASFRFRLYCFKLTNKIAFFGRFFGRLARFLVVSVCLSVSTQKAVILAVFAPQFFDAPPAPKRPPPRPRLPFQIIFF